MFIDGVAARVGSLPHAPFASRPASGAISHGRNKEPEMPATLTPPIRNDWTVSANPGAVRWLDWANEVSRRIGSGDAIERTKALASVIELAIHLDGQYDAGFDGIAIEPQEDLSFSFDR